jgi:hypothetical protein
MAATSEAQPMTIFHHLGGFLLASRELRRMAPTFEEQKRWKELRDRSWRKMSEPHRRIARRIIESELEPRDVAESGEPWKCDGSPLQV